MNEKLVIFEEQEKNTAGSHKLKDQRMTPPDITAFDLGPH